MELKMEMLTRRITSDHSFQGYSRYGSGRGGGGGAYGGQKRSYGDSRGNGSEDDWSADQPNHGELAQRGRWDMESRVPVPVPVAVTPSPMMAHPMMHGPPRPPSCSSQSDSPYSSVGQSSSASPNTPPIPAYSVPYGQVYYPR